MTAVDVIANVVLFCYRQKPFMEQWWWLAYCHLWHTSLQISSTIVAISNVDKVHFCKKIAGLLYCLVYQTVVNTALIERPEFCNVLCLCSSCLLQFPLTRVGKFYGQYFEKKLIVAACWNDTFALVKYTEFWHWCNVQWLLLLTKNCCAISGQVDIHCCIINVVALKRSEMRMVSWMCGFKLKDRLPSKELRD